ARPRASARARLRANSTNASAISAGLSGEIKTPLSPSVIASGTPPTLVAMTGRATDIASSTDSGNASTALVRHKTSAACTMSTAFAHRRIVGNPAWDHTDRVGRVAIAHQPRRLTRRHRDDGVRSRPHRPEEESLVRAERPDSQRVVAQMLGYHMGCALPSGK